MFNVASNLGLHYLQKQYNIEIHCTNIIFVSFLKLYVYLKSSFSMLHQILVYTTYKNQYDIKIHSTNVISVIFDFHFAEKKLRVHFVTRNILSELFETRRTHIR